MNPTATTQDPAPARLEQRPPFGKSAALRWLASHLRTATIPPFLTTSIRDWRRNQADFLASCGAVFAGQPLAVRSDATVEAGTAGSNAGAFLTMLSVPPCGLRAAIARVAASLPGREEDRVMVQAMAPGVVVAGVASTHRIADGAPYYVLELAPRECAVVTGGRAVVQQTALARSELARALETGHLTEAERLVFAMLDEVERLYPGTPLEVEFALGAGDNGGMRVFLLQVRPIIARGRHASTETAPCLPDLAFLEAPDPLPGIAGDRTVLSLMSDWNPAELIGTHPRPLARSLFEQLISRGTWWLAREDLGYRAAHGPGVDLLRFLHGRPLVDVRRSANSLLPRGLDRDTAGQVVDAWIERLRLQPALHDKVEFDVFRTVRDFTAQDEAQRDWGSALTRASWQQWDDALAELTRSIIAAGPSSPLATHMSAIDRFDRMRCDEAPWPELLRIAKECARAFAALARIAFAGEAQLRSAIRRGALHTERAGELRAAARAGPVPGAPDSEGFLARFGHLRPGTFDILQKTWAADAQDPMPERSAAMARFALRAGERRNLDLLLREAGIDIDADAWVRIVQAATAAREHGKLVFSRFLSRALDGIALTVKEAGLDDAHASWLTVDQLFGNLGSGAAHGREIWRRQAHQASRQHEAECMLIISPVLLGDADRFVARSAGEMPNFVGHRAAEGPTVLIECPDARHAMNLRGAVAVLPSADPGFDWLFGAGIVGLLTAWGGANSHLAIRCAEAGIPAAIGCGEAVFARARGARHARIDPSSGGLWLT